MKKIALGVGFVHVFVILCLIGHHLVTRPTSRPARPIAVRTVSIPAPAVIAAAPVVLDAVNVEEECTICHHPVTMRQTTTRTPCNHLFHHACLAPWIGRPGATCPNCRSILSADFQEHVDRFDNDLADQN